MINPKSKKYVASGIAGATGETALVSPDSAELHKIIVGKASSSGTTADIYICDTNNTTLVDTSGSGNVIAHIDGTCIGEYEYKVAAHTGLVYRVNGDYSAGGAPKFTIVYE